jgi:TonB-like protein
MIPLPVSLALALLSAPDASVSPGGTTVVLEAVAPEFPRDACYARIGGPLLVHATALPDGRLTDARVTDGAALLTLRAAALAAAHAWRVTPDELSRPMSLRFLFTVVSEDGARLTPTFRPPFEVEVRCRPPVTADPVVDVEGRTK